MKANTIDVVERLRKKAEWVEVEFDIVERELLIEAVDTIERLRAHIAVLIENDPDEPISDAGHTVIDLWRHEARAMIAAADGK